MPAQYKLIFRSAAGAKVAEVTNMHRVEVALKLNEVGLVRFAMPADHVSLALMEAFGQVEVQRRDLAAGLPWYTIANAFWLDEQVASDEHGLDTFSTEIPTDMALLSWREVLWKDDTANRSVYTNIEAETVAKSIVTYNCTSSGTAAGGRMRDAAFPGFTVSVEGDAARGNALNVVCAWGNVLDVLQRQVAGNIGGGDFDLIKIGPTTWEFRWYSPHRGTDRTDTVTFAREYNNMGTPSYRLDRRNERTIAAVGGQGRKAARPVQIRTGANYSALNDRELFVSANATDQTAFLNVQGDRVLDERKARYEFSFVPLQTPGSQIDRDYFLGDLVAARYRQVETTQKITGVTYVWNEDGKEDIKVDMRTV